MGARVLGIDIGRRRVGLAISDPTRTLARPLGVLDVTDHDVQDRLAAEVARVAAEDDGLTAVVVGVPVRLDGSVGDQTEHVRRVIASLRMRTKLPVHEIDERLTSREAEERLALREPDWRKRKGRLDAAAAAILLQDFLDRG
jgi:putative Holliday junction resolvase